MKWFVLILVSFSPLQVFGAPEDDFVITVELDPDLNNTFEIRAHISVANYNYNIDCNDDGVDEGTAIDTDFTCDYNALGGAGTYTIRIKDNNGDGTGYTGIDFVVPIIGTNPNSDQIIALNQWGTHKWATMSSAFESAENMEILATDVPDLSAVRSTRSMFQSATKANPNTTFWNVSSVTDMNRMFQSAVVANPDTSLWDVSSVLNFERMFNVALAADPDVSGWEVIVAENMNGMFRRASSANPDVTDWNVSTVNEMFQMFFEATNAVPDMSNWQVSDLLEADEMLNGIQLPIELYDEILINFSQQPVNQNVQIDFGDSQYCNGEAARFILTGTRNWSISDGGLNCDPGLIFADGFEAN